jgi:hypothetical protein
VYRKLYNGFLRENPLVSDTDLEGMGLPEQSGKRHKVQIWIASSLRSAQ